MNKLKFLFLFCIFAFAPEEKTENFACEKSTFDQTGPFDVLLWGIGGNEIAQGLVSFDGTQFCFEMSKLMKPGLPIGDSWKLVGFGLGDNLEIKTVITEIIKNYHRHGKTYFTVKKDSKCNLSYEFYANITLPKAIQTNIDPCEVYLCPESEIYLPGLQSVFRRLAHDHHSDIILMSIINEEGFCVVQECPEKMTKYVPTLLTPSSLKMFKAMERFAQEKLEVPGLGVWYDNKPIDPASPDEFNFISVRLNQANTKSLFHLAITDIARDHTNFSYVCQWLGVIDPRKGVYLDENGTGHASTNVPKNAPIVRIDEIGIFLEGKNSYKGWIYKTKEGEIEIRIKATEIKEEPAALEQQPVADPTEQPTSPGSGSSTDAPAVVVAVPEPEPKIVIPQAAFESELQFRTSIVLSPTPKKPLMKDKMLFMTDENGNEKFREYKRTDNMHGYNFTEIVLRIIEKKKFSCRMTMKDLISLMDTLNENCEKLNISAIEANYPEIKGTTHVIFALHEGSLCFGIGKTPADVGNKGIALKGGKPMNV